MSPALGLKAGEVRYERRRHQRFPIRATADVIIAGTARKAAVVELSSGGVLLSSSEPLPVVRQVQRFIDWPALLDNPCLLRLVINGKVLRSDPDGAAVEMARYDYRTMSRDSITFAP